MRGRGFDHPFAGYLPANDDELIGRTAEVNAVTAAITAGAKLVTLTGPGGVGKTRVAIEAATSIEADKSREVWFTSLTSLRYPALLLNRIADALGIAEPADGSLEAAMVQQLASRKLVLVLDGFDHLLDVAPAIERLLSSAPGLQVLITSRTPLRLSNEQIIDIFPLKTPEPNDRPEPADLAGVDSVALFLRRVGKDSSHSAEPEVVAVIAEICKQLAGVPLAIEIVAARGKHASVQSLMPMLETSLSWEIADGIANPDQIMRQTIEWSYDQLDAELRRFFARLSIHTGGFDLDSTRALAAVKPALQVDPAEALAQLTKVDLINRREIGSGLVRYDIPELLREYGLAMLTDTGELPVVRFAQARHALEMATRMRKNLHGPPGIAVLDWFDRDLANLRGAVGASMRDHRVQLNRSLVQALWEFWWIRQHLEEGQRWLNAALDLYDPQDPDGLEPELRYAAALFALGRNDVRAARRLATSGLEIAKQTGDEFWYAVLVGMLGRASAHEGNHQRAIELYDIVVKVIKPLQSSHPEAVDFAAAAHLAMSSAYFSQDEIEESEYQVNAALSIWIRRGNTRGISQAKLNQAAIALHRKEYEAALELYLDSLLILWDAGDRQSVAQGLTGLAGLAAQLKMIDLAAELLGAADALRSTGKLAVAQIVSLDRDEVLALLLALVNQSVIDKGMATGRQAVRTDQGGMIEVAIAALVDKQNPPARGTGKTGSESLSRREREVLCLMVEGMTDQQVADALFISYRTVTSHVEHIFGKLEVTNRSAAVAYAIRNGLC